MAKRTLADAGDLYFVQLRFPPREGETWTTVGLGSNRMTAAKQAGRLFQDMEYRGERATAVRVVSESELITEGGSPAIASACRQLADLAETLV